MVLASVRKAARDAAAWETAFQLPIAARKSFQDSDGPIHLGITFHPPDKRRRDLDGMLSSIKSHLDGLADSLRVDDIRFELSIKRGEPVKLGRVEVEIGRG